MIYRNSKIIISACLVVALGLIGMSQSFANEDVVNEGSQTNFEVGETLEENHVFTTLDMEGNVIELDVEALEESTIQEQTQIQAMGPIGGTSRSIMTGVVNFKVKASSMLNTSYTIDGTGATGYTNGYYGADALYLGHSSDGTKVKFMLSGVVGWVAADEVQVMAYDSGLNVSYYQEVNGRLYHYISHSISSPSSYYAIQVGYEQAYLQSNVKYYSYDGNYFYSSYEALSNDLRNNTNVNAVNRTEPYYNYYQYLSHRSTTSFSAAQLNSRITTGANGRVSTMLQTGQTFIDNQNTYGVNAALMVGVAANESSWGTSYYATTKNNLFGHAAYDSSPDSASGYGSVAESINYHANVFISIGYLDPKDYSGRYKGSHLGNKASGVNVKYASDPYWGEKAAAVVWSIANANPSIKDYQNETIAIKPGISSANIRKEPTTNATVLYQTGPYDDYPFIILDTVSGESINGNSTWYKIQADPTLSADRSHMTQDVGVYDFNNAYAYIHSSLVIVPHEQTETPSTPDPVRTGDVNADGNISPVDYMYIKMHILGSTPLSGEPLKRADVDNSGKITPADYMHIKNYILGRESIIK